MITRKHLLANRVRRVLAPAALLAALLIASPAFPVNRYFIQDQTLTVGDTGVSIPVRLDNDDPRHAFSMSIKYDPAKIEVKTVEVAGTSASNAGWSFGSIIPAEGAVVWGVVMGLQVPNNYDSQKLLPAGPNLTVARLVVDVKATQPTTTTVGFQDGLGLTFLGEPGKNMLTTNGQSVPPDLPTAPATITIQAVPEGTFIRGNANNDDTIDISDAVAILGHLFLGDPAVLACPDSADTDDNGSLEITDAVVVLGHLFLGEPPPPQPFPDPGIDPTADQLPPCA